MGTSPSSNTAGWGLLPNWQPWQGLRGEWWRWWQWRGRDWGLGRMEGAHSESPEGHARVVWKGKEADLDSLFGWKVQLLGGVEE